MDFYDHKFSNEHNSEKKFDEVDEYEALPIVTAFHPLITNQLNYFLLKYPHLEVFKISSHRAEEFRAPYYNGRLDEKALMLKIRCKY